MNPTYLIRKITVVAILLFSNISFSQTSPLPIGTIPPGDSIIVVYGATVNSGPSISNQGSISGANFSTFNTNDPKTPAPNDPTITQVQALTAGAALDFDGTNDFVSVPHNAALNLTTLTVECWIKTSVSKFPAGIVSKYVSGEGWRIYQNNTNITASVNTSGGSCTVNSFGQSISDGAWHHIAFSIDPSGGKIYIDGVLRGTGIWTAAPAALTNTAPMNIGFYTGVIGTDYFQGVVDEVRVWSVARTCDQINQLRNCEFIPPFTAEVSSLLKAYYKFNQGNAGANNASETTLTDATANANNGTLTNFALNGPTSNWVAPGGVTTGVSCPVSISAAEINVKGNNTTIADGNATPSFVDHTDFGNANTGGGNVVRTFTIENTGTATLTISTINVTGTNAAEFVVSGAPSSVTAGSSATFNVTFTPAAVGTRTATVHVNNSDCDEADYDFAVQGTGVTPCLDEINVKGNNVTITDGDATPSAADHTDFGNASTGGGNVVRTFTIENTGTGNLTISSITVTGTNAAEFVVSSGQLGVITAGSSATFNVTFTPTALGARTATIHVNSSDCDEADYDFAVTGNGVAACPAEINVKGNNTTITDGDVTPSATDHTDFGNANTGGGTVVRTFTIENTGTGNLTVTGITMSGADAALFTVGTLTPASPIIAGGSATFTVTFAPTTTGLKTATVNIANNDCDEGTYDFAVQGTGTTVSNIRYVTQSGAGAKDGTSWSNAYGEAEFQPNLNTAVAGLEFWVASGTYKPGATRTTSFGIPSGVSVYGGFAGTETSRLQKNSVANVTILSGDIGTAGDITDNSFHVIYITGMTNITLDGFTIRDGYANGGNPNDRGAGIRLENSSTVTLDSLKMTNNEATTAGGGGIELGGVVNINLQNSTLQNNISGVFGGGIYVFNGLSITVSKCDFISNVADYSGGGIHNEGTMIVNNCRFILNTGIGGGVANVGSTTINKSYFYNNQSLNGGSGAFQNLGGTSTLTNCVLANNKALHATNIGSGGVVLTGTVNLTNCTLSENTTASTTSPNGNGVYVLSGATANLKNTIVWGSAAMQIINEGTINYTNSLVKGETLTCPNKTADPLFINPADPHGTDNIFGTSDDGLMISISSPAKNSGTNTGAPADDVVGTSRPQGTTVDMGAYEVVEAATVGVPEMNVRGNSITITDGDATPSLTDHTDFGNANTGGGNVVRTFTIENTGTDNLTVSGITMTGANATLFTVGALTPASPIIAGGTATFTVTFTPTTAGLKTATVNIANNDCDEGTYDYAVQGNGVTPCPAEINVKGNNTSITDGDVTPSATDHTDFGNANTGGGNVVRIFTIENTGTANLTVTGITMTGADAALFTVGALTPASPIAAGGSATFTVTFAPTTTGLKTATVNIANNDCDEGTYDYAVQGTGVNPCPAEINVKGNTVSIVDGDVTPSATDHTDFGNANTGGGNVVRTFTIENTGTANLTVTGITMTGANAALFTVGTLTPASPIIAGGTATFTVTFAPTTTGLKTATVNIASNDCDEGTYDYAVQGTGIPPLTMFYVNDGFTSGDGYTTATGNDATGNGTTTAPYRTITKALSLASAGNTIFVDAGTYTEDVLVNKAVTIRGLDSSKTIVQPATSNPVGSGGTLGGNTIFLVQANNVTIQDLTADGNNPGIGGAVDARNGIVTDFNSGDYTNLVVHHVTVKNIYFRGIYSAYGSTPGQTFNFHHNTVTNVQGDPNGSIGIFNFGNAGIIDSNKVSNTLDAIAANQSTGTRFSNNITTGSGIHTDNNGGSGGATDTLKGNTIANVGSGGYGIMLFQPSFNVIVEENTITGANIGIGNIGAGVPAGSPVFRRNTIDGQNAANSTGVFQTTSIPGFTPSNVSGTYLNNFIKNNQQGFYLKQEAGFTSTIEVHENSITNNPTTVAIAVGPDGAGTLTNNFSCNWYGGSAPVVTGGTLNYQPTLIQGTDNELGTPGFQPVPGSCRNCVTPDVIAPTITLKPSPTVFLNAANTYTVQLSDVLQSVTDNCDPNPTTTISTLTVTCANLGSGGGSSTPHQPFVANSSTGNQNFQGELGMDFRVNAASGIVINQLGAFDHQGNGITGTQPDGNGNFGIRVAIFSKATQAIVPGLSAVIVGNGDSYSGNYRYKNIPAVNLPQGDYIVIAKGYNANELEGNSYISGGPYPQGDNASGAISYLNTAYYGADNPSGFSYPTGSINVGTSSIYKAGTFTYALSQNNTVTVTAKDASNNQSQVNVSVTVIDTFYVLTTKDITVALNSSGQATIQPTDVLQSLKNNCGIDVTSSTLQVSPSSFNCSNIGGGSVPSSTSFYPFVANSSTGNQNFQGELGMDFRVNAANGISINQLGAFDHQGDGLIGTQPDGNGNFGIRVAIFSKTTQAIVPGLSTVIVGNGDSYSGNYRYKNIPAVTLPQGDYIVIAKGYNANELEGNSYMGGGPYPQGDNAGGAISYLNFAYYGADNPSGFSYPTGSINVGTSSIYKAGTFVYKTLTTGANVVTLTATDVYGHQKQATANVSVVDNSGPMIVTKNITLPLNNTGNASITPNDVLQSPITDNCGVNNASISVSPNSFTCADYSAGGGSGTPHQPFIANSSAGNQVFQGELGMDFRVNAAGGIIINQLGAFDDQGNGITGTQPDGNGNFGIRVAIFSKTTQAIVPGLSAVIVGNGDSYSGNYRYKNIPAVNLPQGDYIVIAKGYNAAEPEGNSYISGGPYPQGDNAGGAISYLNTAYYGADNPSGFSYPTGSINVGTSSIYKAGTFTYALGLSNSKTVTVTATDIHGNTSQQTAVVTLTNPSGSCTPAPVMTYAAKSQPTDGPVILDNVKMSLNVYPNPSSGQFSVQLMNVKAPTVTLQIMDANGQVIVQKTAAPVSKTSSLTIPVDISKHASGIYLIKVISTDGIQTAKVVVSR